MAARAHGRQALSRRRNMVFKKNSIAAAAFSAVLTSCAVVPYPYWKSESLEKEFIEDFPPDLRASDVKILALEQRARLIDREGCKSGWELGCGHESTEQMIEAPIFARGKDVERIVSDTRVDRIQGVGFFVELGLAVGPIEGTRSGTRLKALAIIIQDGSVFCTKAPIERHSLGRMFRSYKLSAASKEAALAALETAVGNVTLPLVPGSCQLSGAFSWSDAERQQVIEFLHAIPAEPTPPSAQPTQPPPEPSRTGAK
jgi:hypothetical protein